MRRATAIATITFAIWVGTAISTGVRQAGAQPAPEMSLPSDEPVPSCLDQSIAGELGDRLRPRGVQKRTFQKRGKLQLTGRGGLLAGDLLSSSYIAGGAAAFFVTEDLGVEFSIDVSPQRLEIDAPIAEFFGDDRFESGRGLLAFGNLLWSPIHGKLKMGDSILHADFLLLGGAGRLFHDSTQGLGFTAGAALQIFAYSWLSTRFEIRDIILIQEAVGETRTTNNIMATFGLTFWIPTGY